MISASSENKDLYDAFYERISIHKEERDKYLEKSAVIKGEVIKKVTYVIHNYQDRLNVFDDFHIVDQAIIIELSNGKGVSWIFEDDGSGDYYYNLFFKDYSVGLQELIRFNTNLRKEAGELWQEIEPVWLNVSSSKAWSGLIGKRLNNVRFLTSTHKSKDYITDVILEIEGRSVYVSATAEPESSQLPNLSGIPYAKDWTVVTFSKDLINLFGRKGL